MDCVNEVKKDIEKRKAHQAKDIRYDKQEGCCSPVSGTASTKGIPKFMTLEQFKSQDKVKLMELVFGNQEFLNTLYQVMFWHKMPSPPPPVNDNSSVFPVMDGGIFS